MSKNDKDRNNLDVKKTNPFGVPTSCRSVSDVKTGEAGGNILQGHFAVFGQSYTVDDWDGKFIEIIERGAFDKTDFTDVPFTYNHQLCEVPMARSRNNTPNSTLQLGIDNIGPSFKASLDLENNEDSRKTYSAVGRGDLADMSYIFHVREDESTGTRGEWWEGLDTNLPTRHITDIAKVFEVSAVTWGANSGTDINARSRDVPEGALALESARRKKLESSNEQPPKPPESRSEEPPQQDDLEVERLRAIFLLKN